MSNLEQGSQLSPLQTEIGSVLDAYGFNSQSSPPTLEQYLEIEPLIDRVMGIGDRVRDDEEPEYIGYFERYIDRDTGEEIGIDDALHLLAIRERSEAGFGHRPPSSSPDGNVGNDEVIEVSRSAANGSNGRRVPRPAAPRTPGSRADRPAQDAAARAAADSRPVPPPTQGGHGPAEPIGENAHLDPATLPHRIGDSAPDSADVSVPASVEPASEPTLEPSTPDDSDSSDNSDGSIYSAFRAAFGLKGVTLKQTMQEMSLEEVKQIKDVPSFIIDKAVDARDTEAGRWGAFMDLPAEEQVERLSEAQPSFLETWKAKLFPERTGDTGPDANNDRLQRVKAIGIVVMDGLRATGTLSNDAWKSAFGIKDESWRTVPVELWNGINHAANQGIARWQETSRTNKNVVYGALGFIAAGAAIMGVMTYDSETTNAAGQALPTSPVETPQPEVMPSRPPMPDPELPIDGGPFPEATVDSAPEATADTTTEPTEPLVPAEIELEAYNSQTGAGTVEGTAYQQALEQGVDVNSLTSEQLSSFKNELRTETLRLNGLTEAQAYSLQVDDVIRLLHQEQIEAILESIRSK